MNAAITCGSVCPSLAWGRTQEADTDDPRGPRTCTFSCSFHIILSREAVFFRVMHQDTKALVPGDWGTGCCLGTVLATYCRLMLLWSSLDHQLPASSSSLPVTVPLRSRCTARDCSIQLPGETQGRFQNFTCWSTEMAPRSLARP